MLPGAEARCKIGGLVAQSVKQKCFMLMWWLCGVIKNIYGLLNCL